MKKLIAVCVLVLTLGCNLALACYKHKQCCQRDYRGMQCITVCDYERCPYDFPIEIK
jgi:hypothetical protein